MTERPPSCIGCKLHDDKTAIGFMSPEGTGSSGVLVIAEALGEREANESLPLRPNAPAGSVFQGIIRRIAGLDRNQLLLSNAIWCRPGIRNWLDGAPYEFQALEHCQQYNRKLVSERRPRAIVTLGAIPTRTVTGMAGYNQGIKLVRGFVLQASRPEYFVDGVPLPVIASYHPSFLLRASKTRSKDKDSGDTGAKIEKAEGGMSLSGVVTRDIQLAFSIAKNGPPSPHQFQTIKGNRDVFQNLIREYELHPEWDIAWDIETPRSIDMADDESEIDSIQARVTQIQFAHHADAGYVFPGFEAEYVREGTRKLLALPNRKLSWNGWKFDNKVVSGHHGIPILGLDVDLMSAWHWIQPDLPQGLQFATSFHAPHLHPWKHLAISDEDTYGACDVISLILNRDGILDVMDKRGLRTSYDRHCLTLRTEMVAASHRGFPVDPERHDKFGRKVNAEIQVINDSIQAIIPEDILALEPKRKPKGSTVAEFGYVNTPKQITSWLDDQGNPKDGSDRVRLSEEVPVEDDDGNPIEGEFETRTVVYSRRSVQVFNKETLDFESLQRWCRIKPFSMGSPQQKIVYIKYRREEEIAKRLAKGQSKADAERLAKHKVPQVRNKQKEMKDNTGAKELEKLFKATGDPVYQHLVEIGKLKKLYGTYYKGWAVRNGFVHTTFGVADTGTGQLSSVAPNIQNCGPGDMEALTSEGWKRFDELREDTKVAEYLPNQAIKFVIPEQVIRQAYKGSMIDLETEEQISLRFTPDHECLLRHRKTGELRKFSACNYPEDWKQEQAGFYVGGKTNWPKSHVVLACALQADGHVLKQAGRNPGGQISWKLKKARKIERLEWALEEAQIPFTKKGPSKRGFTSFYVPRPPQWLASKKVFGPWVLDLDKPSFEFLSEEIWKWDGWAAGRTMYSSSIKSNAEWAQIITALNGRRAHLREYWNGNPNSIPNWQVDASLRSYSLTTNRTRTEVPFDGMVYCVTVPSGNIVVRYKDRIAITGNCPKHSELAKEFRGCILAKPGKRLVEIDKKSFHAQTLAFEAKDVAYARLSAIDVHSYMTAHRLKFPEAKDMLSWSDKDLGAFFKSHKCNCPKGNCSCPLYKAEAVPNYPNGLTFQQVRDYKSKRVILGIGFCQGALSIFEQNPEGYKDKKEVQTFLDLFGTTFKEVKKFQGMITQLAHKQTYLTSRWGYIRRFYDTFQWNPNKWNQFTGSMGDWAHGDDFEAAVAFLPANDAFGMLKEEMLRLAGYAPWPDQSMNRVGEDLFAKYNFINQIHDSLIFMPPTEQVDKCLEDVILEMRRPCPVLYDPGMELLGVPGWTKDGLFVDAEAMVGDDWSHMEGVKI